MIFTLFFFSFFSVLTGRQRDVKWAKGFSAWISVCSNENYIIKYKITMDFILIIYIAMHMQ